MAAILGDSVVAVAAVVRTRPRAIQLAMITMRKSIHGFPSVFYMGMGSAWRPLPELRYDISFVGVSLKTTRERIFFHILFINATDAGGFDLGYL